MSKNDEFYLDNVDRNKKFQLDKTFIENETIKSMPILHDDDILKTSRMNYDDMMRNGTIYYISDLHLDYKIAKKFPKSVSKGKITEYIASIVDSLLLEYEKGPFLNKYMLIGGDVSYSFEISKLFYQILADKISFRKRNVIVILGNHEYWEENNVSDTIEKYKKLLDSLEITFLHNELLCCEVFNQYKINEEDMLNASEEELRQKYLNCGMFILGGTGFSGLNAKYNANIGLYRSAIKTIDEDMQQSTRFERLYLKIKSVLNDRNVIVFTHTPKSDWSSDNYNCNWVYVYGHNHQNEYYKDELRTIYADNQVGYNGTDFTLKHFYLSRKYNIFKYYKDGIYCITIDEYKSFYRGMGMQITYNRKDGNIYMLKRDGLLCFILKNDKEILYLLEGGNRRKLNIQDINYYFDNMTFYSRKIKETTKKFNDFLKEVSSYVKSFGGYGTIHGCIVDIDFYNHLYINPYDATITPYFALSIIDKYVYKDLGKMLSNNCPELYLNYKKMINDKNEIMIRNNNEIKLSDFEHYENTDIYKTSRIMKALQYLVDDDIIRIWNDNLINEKEQIENILIEEKK